MCLWDKECGYFQINHDILSLRIESQGLSDLLISNSEFDLDTTGASFLIDIHSLNIWGKFQRSNLHLSNLNVLWYSLESMPL